MVFNHQVNEKLQSFEFILASTSPRRKQILKENLQIDKISVVSPHFDENLVKQGRKIEEYVSETSKGKIESVYNQIIENLDGEKNYVILSSDTVIACEDEIFEKPLTNERQLEMLKKYRSATNLEVITSVNSIAIENGVRRYCSGIESTKLVFDYNVSDDLLQRYVDSGEGLNVAGGFMFQSAGCLLFKKIEGDYFNVVGLPVRKTFQILNEILGII